MLTEPVHLETEDLCSNIVSRLPRNLDPIIWQVLQPLLNYSHKSIREYIVSPSNRIRRARCHAHHLNREPRTPFWANSCTPHAHLNKTKTCTWEQRLCKRDKNTVLSSSTACNWKQVMWTWSLLWPASTLSMLSATTCVYKSPDTYPIRSTRFRSRFSIHTQIRTFIQIPVSKHKAELAWGKILGKTVLALKNCASWAGPVASPPCSCPQILFHFCLCHISEASICALCECKRALVLIVARFVGGG